jgi:hypothetical protein
MTLNRQGYATRIASKHCQHMAAMRPKVAISVRGVTQAQARTMFATGPGIARV